MKAVIWLGFMFLTQISRLLFKQEHGQENFIASDCVVRYFEGGEHWGLRYCDIGPFFLQYFGEI